jgi:LysM repeat protein
VSERISDPGVVCPFVAFDDDRDHRGPGPDHRHRCFAESPAAPRALAHQAAYCLSTSFPSCPTFVDWARREAAPVRQEPPGRSLRDAPAPRGGVAAAWPGEPAARPADEIGTAPVAGAPDAPGAAAPAVTTSAAGPGPDDTPAFLAGRAARSDSIPAADEAWAPPAEEAAWGSAPPDGVPGSPAATPPMAASPATAPAAEERHAPPAEPDAPDDDRYAEPRRIPVGYAPVAASRTDRRPVAGGSGRSSRDHRDASAPAWEEPRRVDSYPTLKSKRAGGIPRPLTLALVVLVAGAALFATPFLLQGLTGGGDEPGPTPAPTSSSEPTAEPTPTPEPTPEVVVYVVKQGDTLSGIATQFGLTVDQVLAANPQIENANQIAVGDRITIPPAEPSGDDASTPAP